MNRKTLIAAVVFVALVLGALFSMKGKQERGISHLSLTALDKSRIDGFELSGAQTVKLSKKDGSWKLENGRAGDGAAIDRAIDMLATIDSTEVVTNKPERFADYDVTDEKGTHLRLTAAGQAVADVVIGKSAKGTSYVRRGNDVFEVSAAKAAPGKAPFMAGFFTRPAASWQLLKLFTDTVDEVSRVEVALKGQAPYALVKADGKWKFEDAAVAPANFRFDETAAKAYVNTLVNTAAKQILDSDPGAEATGLTDGDRIAFVGKDGARRELRLGNANAEKQIYARIEGSPDVAVLPEFVNKTLRKAATDFRELTLMSLDTTKATGLTLKSGKTVLALEKKGGEWKVAKSSETVPAGFAVDASKVDQRLGALAGARAMRMASAEEASGAGLAKPTATLVVAFEGGKDVTLTLGAETKADGMDAVFARGNIDGDVYVLGKWVRDQLTGGLPTFKK